MSLCLTSVNWLYQNNEFKKWSNKHEYGEFRYFLTLIICCNELLFFIILNSSFTESLHFPSVFTHGFIQLLFNVMNWIKIITQAWLGLLCRYWTSYVLLIELHKKAINITKHLFISEQKLKYSKIVYIDITCYNRICKFDNN